METSGIKAFCEKNPDVGALLLAGDEAGKEIEYNLFGTAGELVDII